MKPLADRIRPDKIDNIVGQTHLLGKNRILRNIIESGNISNMIFYGPSGTGKTTVANIIASATDRKLYKLNATTASVSDIKEIIDGLNEFDGYKGVLLYLDEIQNFNKKQQQSLLQFIEDGSIILIASTTENPYFYVYNAILSRSNVFEFRQIAPNDIVKALKRGTAFLEGADFDESALREISYTCGGDLRAALNLLELLYNAYGREKITAETVSNATFRKSLRYDKSGDNHYDILSAFQKSIRGSDPDAGLHYLARILESGDIKSPVRRLLVIASEDIGMAYPNAASIVKSLCDSALMLGLPEAQLPLAQAVILLATAPKSNSVTKGMAAAMRDVESIDCGDIPAHIKDAHYSGAAKLGRGLTYKYPHDYENNYIEQQYLPDSIKDKIYYVPGDNKNERAIDEYRKKIMKKIIKFIK